MSRDYTMSLEDASRIDDHYVNLLNLLDEFRAEVHSLEKAGETVTSLTVAIDDIERYIKKAK